MIKKLVAAGLAVILSMSVLTGCESTLRKNIERAEEEEVVQELDVKTLFSAENGYHYNELLWGMTSKQASKILPISAIAGYGEDGSMTYEVSAVRFALAGLPVEAASLRVTPDGSPDMFSLVIGGDEKSESYGKRSEAFDTFLSVLTEEFGEADSTRDEEKKVADGMNGNFVGYYWDYETPDGKKTQLQWSKVTMTGASDAAYLVLGFVWENSIQ